MSGMMACKATSGVTIVTDADNDGIADTPYVINQWSNNIDRYPLIEPTRIEVRLPLEPEPTASPTPAPTSTPELVSTPEPFPTTLVVASVITVAFVGVGLLVYFKKRKGRSL